MRRSDHLLGLTALAAALVLANVSRAGADNVATQTRLALEYPSKRITVTFSALSGIKSCFDNPADYRKLAQKYPVAVRILAPLLREHVKTVMADSIAFLLVDFGSPNVTYKSTHDPSGQTEHLDAAWGANIVELADLIDSILDNERYAKIQKAEIGAGKVSLAEAWTTFKEIHGNSKISLTTTAQVAVTVKTFYFNNRGAQHEFQELPDATKREMSTLLFDTKYTDLVLLGKAEPPIGIVKSFEQRVPSLSAE